MRIPGTPSIIFLAYLLLILPGMALRGARRLKQIRSGSGTGGLPTRQAIWVGTMAVQCSLLFLAWLTGRGFGFEILAVPALGVCEFLAGLAALAASFGLRAISRVVRTEEERRGMTVYLLAPRTGREWALWSGTVMVASVAEEAAYRGVGMSILWYSLGDPRIAVLVCATAFALAHCTQGWKSTAVIFTMALVLHGLVWFTGTLVVAMVVHALYDFVAGYRIARDAERFRREAPGALEGAKH